MARYDWPEHWPGLFEHLGSQITSQDPRISRNCLSCLQQVVKSLASRRLAVDKKNFQEMAENVFPNVFQLLTDLWATTLTSDAAIMYPEMQLHALLLLTKTLHYLLNYGYCVDTVPRGHVFHTFINFCIDQIGMFLIGTYVPKLEQLEPLHTCRDLFGKITYRVTKCLVSFHETYPLRFSEHVPDFLTKVVATFFKGDFDLYRQPYSIWTIERFCVKLVNFMRLVIRCRDYEIDSDQEDSNIPKRAILEFCNRDFLSTLLQKLLTTLMKLSPDDMEKWEIDPEAFVVREPLEDFEHCFRMAIELFLIAIFVEFDEIIPQMLSERVNKVLSLQSETEVDCLYNAIGQVALQFHQMDFTSFFNQLLIPQLQSPNEQVPELIKWRILWLLSKIPDLDHLTDEMRATFFAVFAHCLASSQYNLSLRLQAMITLKCHIDSASMNETLLNPHLNQCIQGLGELLQEVQSDDSRLLIINCLSSLIECAGKDVRPCLPGIERIFGIAWNLETSHELLRGAVLTSLTNLVNSLEGNQEDQALILPAVMSAINVCTERTQTLAGGGTKFSALLEDTLDLWFAALSNCESTSPSCSQFFQLLPRLFIILHNSAENLSRCLDIIEAYYLLDPKSFIQTSGEQLVQTLLGLIGNLKYDLAMSILRLIDLVLVSSPEQSQLFFPVLNVIFSRAIHNEDSGAILAGYIATFSRFCICSPQLFSSFISTFAESNSTDVPCVLGHLSDTWSDRFQFSAPLDRRKLMAMTLLSLLQVPAEPIYARFSSILNIVVDVFHDLAAHPDSDKPFVDMLATSLPEVIPHSVVTEAIQNDNLVMASVVESRPHIRRKKTAQRNSDPVYAISFDKFAMEKIALCQQSIGSDRFEQLLASTDADVVHQLKFHLEGRKKSSST